MTKFQDIVIGNAKASPTNVKGRIDGKTFDELVESIKEKGVLVPVLARKMKNDKGAQYFEVIAGNRRLEAARKAGLKFLPAQIVEMNDIEAREAQIIENLQREGVHPIDEGEQYRELIEKSKYEISAVAANVGKSESYVKQRLFLTNMNEKTAKAYRAGKINDGHAVLIAKLSTGDQDRAYKSIDEGFGEKSTVKELKEWIESNVYSQLGNQPWTKSEELMKAVGECVECEPNKASLFGPVKVGECTSLKCWNRKMKKFIDYMAKKDELVKISSEYGSAEKGLRSKSEYAEVTKKDKCEFSVKAIVAQGSGLGKVLSICFDKKCEVHGGSSGQYKLTPEERAQRKEDKRIEKEKKIKETEKREKKLSNVLEKIKWPLSEKHVEALFELVMNNAGMNVWRNVAKRNELEVKKVKTEYSSHYDYEKAIRSYAIKLDNQEQLRLIFELLIDSGYESLVKGYEKI